MWASGAAQAAQVVRIIFKVAAGFVAVYLTAGRGLIPRRGDWLPGTAWDMSDLAPLSPSVAERCEPAPEDATFTHVCGE